MCGRRTASSGCVLQLVCKRTTRFTCTPSRLSALWCGKRGRMTLERSTASLRARLGSAARIRGWQPWSDCHFSSATALLPPRSFVCAVVVGAYVCVCVGREAGGWKRQRLTERASIREGSKLVRRAFKSKCVFLVRFISQWCRRERLIGVKTLQTNK